MTRIQVLGCSGSLAAGHHTTSFRVDDDLLLDAGSGVGTLSVTELQSIDHVLLTHAHLDHILALPLLADTVMRYRLVRGLPPIQVLAPADTLDTLRRHLFNDALWPDFTRLPSVQAPVIALHDIRVGDALTLGTRRVQVLPARHSIPAVGYAIWTDGTAAQGRAWAFSGDTGPNPEIGPVLQSLQPRHWVLEVAFADRDQGLAAISGHHCPATLEDELRRLDRQTQVHLTHIKPGEAEAVLQDLQARGLDSRVRFLQVGDEFTV